MQEQKEQPKENGVNKPVEPETQKEGGATPPKSENENKENQMIPIARLNEALEKAREAEKKAQKLEKQAEEAKRKQLEENNQFKDLYETEKKAREEQEQKTRETVKRAAFISAAHGKNIVSLDDAYILAKGQLDSLEINDQEQVVGIEDVINKIVTDKPWLVGKQGNVQVGSPTNPAPSGNDVPVGARIYTHSEVDAIAKDPVQWEKYGKDIQEALGQGRIR